MGLKLLSAISTEKCTLGGGSENVSFGYVCLSTVTDIR
jgi:hypothetical protein